MHIHGYTPQVVKMGWPSYDAKTQRAMHGSDAIICDDPQCKGADAGAARWAQASWRGGHMEGMVTTLAAYKDTVIVPAGGYIVLRFKADNPGTAHSLLTFIGVDNGCEGGIHKPQGHKGSNRGQNALNWGPKCVEPEPKCIELGAERCRTRDWNVLNQRLKLNRGTNVSNQASKCVEPGVEICRTRGRNMSSQGSKCVELGVEMCRTRIEICRTRNWNVSDQKSKCIESGAKMCRTLL